jgi:hypothetical protein
MRHARTGLVLISIVMACSSCAQQGDEQAAGNMAQPPTEKTAGGGAIGKNPVGLHKGQMGIDARHHDDGHALAVADRAVLSGEGLGPVRIGMRYADAEQAIGAGLSRDMDQDPSGACVILARKDGRDPAITYLGLDGIIQRIDIGGPGKVPFRVASGVTIGSPEAMVRKIYAGSIEALDNYDDDAAPVLLVKDGTGRTGTAFHIENHQVTGIAAGTLSAVRLPEACA